MSVSYVLKNVFCTVSSILGLIKRFNRLKYNMRYRFYLELKSKASVTIVIESSTAEAIYTFLSSVIFNIEQ